MIKKALDEKYSYQIDEYNVVHLFRGEDEYQQYLINPLLSAIFKIENFEKENAELKKINADGLSELNHINGDLIIENEKLKKENTELKKELVEKGQHLDLTEREWEKDMSKMIHYKTQSTKTKEIINKLIELVEFLNEDNVKEPIIAEAEQFLKETEE
jgi:hypothetical protein